MPFKSIVRELKEIRDGINSSSKWGSGSGITLSYSWSSKLQPCDLEEEDNNQGMWANLPTELLLDIIQRIETSEVTWPARRNVASCSSVCRSWRRIAKEVVQTLEESGRITFPISLKQPGPRDGPIQCFIRRERGTSTYRLYLGLSPSTQVEKDKLLLAARKVRRATSTEFFISLSCDDFSECSSAYIGKLKSNFLGTKFKIYDSQPPQGTPISHNRRSSRIFNSRQVSPRVPAGNYKIATLGYEINICRARGPRRLKCTLNSIPISSIQEDGSAPTPTRFIHSLDQVSGSNISEKDSIVDHPNPVFSPLFLKNKTPRWHEQLQCWCLNFRGRVTVASVKNFQLTAAVESQQVSVAEQEKVLLQFGKIGKDIFTMDYRYPLSAFQAFAICLSSFDTKPICE